MNNRNQYLIVATGIVLFGALVFYFRNIVSYVLIAWVISMVGTPISRFLQQKVKIFKWKIGPSLAALITLILFTFIILSLLSVFIPLVVAQANNLSQIDYAGLARTLQEPLEGVNRWLSRYGITYDPVLLEQQLRDLLADSFSPGKIGSFFTRILSTAGKLIVDIVSIFFISFFFLKENNLFTNFLSDIAPAKYESRVIQAVAEISEMLTRYFGGVLIQISMFTVILMILLTLFGIKNAILIAFFAGLLNVIPYVGPLIGGVFGVFITLSANLDLDFYDQVLPKLIKVVISFWATQNIDNFFLQPYIFSKSVKAHPLEIFLVILMGAQVGGVTGMVIAIPAYTALRVIAKVFLSRFRFVQKMADRMEEEEIGRAHV